jgi:hypothetical protein
MEKTRQLAGKALTAGRWIIGILALLHGLEYLAVGVMWFLENSDFVGLLAMMMAQACAIIFMLFGATCIMWRKLSGHFMFRRVIACISAVGVAAILLLGSLAP